MNRNYKSLTQQRLRPGLLFSTAFCLLLSLLCGSAQAGIIELDPIDEGSVYWEKFTSAGPFWPSWEVYDVNRSHDSMFSALYDQPPEGTGEIQVQRWVIYDLFSVSDPVTSATLEFDLSPSQTASRLAVNPLDTYTPEQISALADGPHTNQEASQLFGDIGTGPEFGATELTVGQRFYSVDLNAAALALINGSGGKIAFGLNHPYIGDFYDIGFNSSPRLVLNDGPTGIPVAGTLWLIALAAPLMLRIHSRRHRA